MPYGENINITLDNQEIKDIIALIKRQDLKDETTRFLFEPILFKLEKEVKT